ncbi:FAD-dependent oxidoreductase [Luteimonas sp. e5]
MSRRRSRDVVVVGAGIAGAACALGLAREGLQVALVEAGAPPVFSPAERSLRVVALAPDNAALLDELGVWPDVLSVRAQAYRRMRVWDAAGGGELVFDADDFARRELGWIVENEVLAARLWQAAERAGVELLSGSGVTGMELDEDTARVHLESGEALTARLLIGADGARSRLRELAGIEVSRHDYGQRGVVAYVEAQDGHAWTAWQRFLPGGPLALLPADAERLCSIVWSLPDAEARRVLALDAADFERELTLASAHRLGELRLRSPRAAFPLRRLLARTQVQGRLLLIGDAAHVVHPLAGQGINLGLRDVAALREALVDARQRGRDLLSSPHRLQRWARARRSDNVASTLAFEAINRVYSNDSLLPTLLRGHALAAANAITPLRHALWRHAAGL